MNELRSILEAAGGPPGGLSGAILATVVHVKGSAYRRPGARMLIFPDGRRIGTISGGCLEGDVARKARWWIGNTGNALRVYDTSSEGAAWEFGLGCNGVISVLLEDAQSSNVQEMLRFMASCVPERLPMVIATVVRAPVGGAVRVGDRMFCSGHGAVGGNLRLSPMAPRIAPLVDAARCDGVSGWYSIDDVDVFVERIEPAQRLVIFGAGHDVVPVVRMAALLGWSVTVADTRAGYAQPGRFAGADRVTLLPSSGRLDEAGIEICDQTAVVMMTHNYPLDLQILPQVLERQPRYLGCLGPRSRSERLFAEAHGVLDDQRVHAPVGLDIGSDHPETIALSIVSEIQSAIAGRTGGSLRFRAGPIHAPVREVRAAPRDDGGPGVADEESARLETCEARGLVHHG